MTKVLLRHESGAVERVQEWSMRHYELRHMGYQEVRKEPSKMKRALLIDYNDGTESTELEIGKAASIKTGDEFIHIEKMKDGKWRLIYSESLIEDFSKVKSLTMLRED